ncbi:adaptor protein MecA [Sporolactobacillus putidus]|uniref:Adapter protein MecA n=1 Tax=Sporolactobacillus putidus TaxID=492735 RepID=A0A917RYQ8_9BACL|nr:adaptor protein MecA [Sporolactobacillus putidus]GGL45740.1 adapter protein MecA 1 [Sporolactobacillus putidus]
MKIERINENTLKFYISYLDIEDRGFDREEIWYNRDRSEELFWQMMDEAHSQESFSLEGPLWIQVQALEKGMEIIVTRAQISKDGSNLQLPVSTDKQPDSLNENSETDPDDRLPGGEGEQEKRETYLKPRHNRTTVHGKEGDDRSFVIEFEDIEDLILLSHAFESHEGVDTALFAYDEKYYLNVLFSEELSDDRQDDDLSTMLEFGIETNLTCFTLQEYGKELIGTQALKTIKSHFPLIP